MRIQCKVFDTLPSKKDSFFQIVLIPTVSILNSISDEDKYIAINFEWLFWSFTTVFDHGSKR